MEYTIGMKAKAKKKVRSTLEENVDADEPIIDINLLSLRERDVFTLISRAYESCQIGKTLKISIKTVETYYEHIKKKFNLKGIEDLRFVSFLHYFEKKSPDPVYTFSFNESERRIFYLMGKRKLTNTDLGEELFLSPKTIETYTSRMKIKLGVKNIYELRKLAVQNQLFLERNKHIVHD